MAERTDQRTRSDDTGVETVIDTEQNADQSGKPADGGLRDRVDSLFSVRGFLLVLVLTLVATVATGMVVPLGGFAGFLGIAVVGFGVGLADTTPRYPEHLVAGGVAAGLGTLFDNLLLTALGVGVPLLAVGVGAGALAGVVGHYLGRDLRDGLTRDL